MKLIKFGSDGCAPCRAMDKAKTLERFRDKHDIEVVKIDIELKPKLAERYEVQSIPTLIFESDDGVELARDVGALPLRDIETLHDRAKSADSRRSKHKGIGDVPDADDESEDDAEDDETEEDDDAEEES